MMVGTYANGWLAQLRNEWCRVPLHETTQYGKSTGIAIAAKLYGYLKCQNQNPLP
jgi:hypothetical protein